MTNHSGQEGLGFVIVDVFTDRAFAGNPLAVFPRADVLEPHQMQTIARELNLSETTFVVSPRTPSATRRLRCFSPAAEVFGAGHNALGAWWVLLTEDGLSAADVVWQELGERVLPVTVSRSGDTIRRLSMTQPFPATSPVGVDLQPLARALGLGPRAISPDVQPCVTSAGATNHLLVALRTLDDVRRIQVDATGLTAFAKALGCEGCYAFSLETADRGSVAHARGFFPGIGIAEDPATGSAAGPLGMYLVSLGLSTAEEWLVVEQGDVIQRPSRIEVRISSDLVEVGGRCVVVGAGEIRA